MNLACLAATQYFKLLGRLKCRFGLNIQESIAAEYIGQLIPEHVQPVFSERRVQQHEIKAGIAQPVQGHHGVSCVYPDLQRPELVAQGSYGCNRSRVGFHHLHVGGTARSNRKSTRLNSSHVKISYAVFCLKKKKQKTLLLDVT